MVIRLEGVFTDIDMSNDIQFYAECYYLDEKQKTQLHTITHNIPTFQNSTYYGESTVLKKGTNHFKLNFNHPVHSIYFWGFDKTKVKRITLTLNDYNSYKEKPQEQPDTIYYDGSIEPLEYYKESRNIFATPTFIFFSDTKMNERPKSMIHFSSLDYPILTIETEQEDEPTFYLNGINIQGYMCIGNEMFGLVFSK